MLPVAAAVNNWIVNPVRRLRKVMWGRFRGVNKEDETPPKKN
jgi:hypothetical protein